MPNPSPASRSRGRVDRGRRRRTRTRSVRSRAGSTRAVLRCGRIDRAGAAARPRQRHPTIKSAVMRIQSTVGGAAVALASTILASAARPATAQRSSTTTATVPRDIRAILRAHCTICHSPGGPSPMPLVTDEDVLPRAQKIKEQTLARRMPIWHAARGYGAFSNDPTLTPYEFELIVSWADHGSENGEARPGHGATAERPPERPME